MPTLIDTSFLLALFFTKDENHRLAREAAQILKGERLVAAAVLPEMFYMIATRAGYDHALKAFTLLQTTSFSIVELQTGDMAKMREIMMRYRDASFDYVDTAIMALSERLNVQDIYTFDHRDFRRFKPRHCECLRILP